MLCESCGERDAVVQLTQIVNNEVKTLRLCERCAAEKGVQTTEAPKNPLLNELLQSVHSHMPAAAVSGAQADATRCTFCSMSYRDFRASGRLGCAHCYGAFERSLRELLRRVHGNSRHVGRRSEPPRPETMERATTLGELRERLRRAIEQEQFELAADIRDRIRVLE